MPNQIQQEGRKGCPNTLPYILAKPIFRLGFKATDPFGQLMPYREGPRRYILRPHSFPLTVILYKERILPYLYAVVPGTRQFIPDGAAFERMHEYAQFLYCLDLLQLEDLEARDPKTYVEQLLHLPFGFYSYGFTSPGACSKVALGGCYAIFYILVLT
ncbi:hypothetical protein WKW50_24090 [Ochrobactrum sp. GPK 3]